MKRTGLEILLVVIVICQTAVSAEQVYRLDNAVVSFSEIDMQYAEAIARTAQAAREVAIEKFGLDMPETIRVSITVDPRGKVRLFNDGNDRLYLTVKSQKNLAKPSESGIYHIYGICHEVGHLGMYRAVRDHSWLTTAAAEGWTHYTGSRIVDGVYEKCGGQLWPDEYNYLEDGTGRLKKQMAAEKPSNIVTGAALWSELAQIVTDKGLADVLAAWGRAKIDPADPGAGARKALLTVKEDKRLGRWWNKAEPVFVLKREKSDFGARTADRRELAMQPLNLAHDDGRQAGKKSIAGSGHAVRFEVAGNCWYLTNVMIYGSRYGHRAPPNEDFHVWLCDKDFRIIADFPQPYSKFKRGKAGWVNLNIEPTNVPPEFIACVGFNPTGTKGVYVGYDAEASGNSFTGIGGKKPGTFENGDWLIRARVDQLKSADALRVIE